MSCSVFVATRRGPLAVALFAILSSACVSTTDDLLGVAALPPLDRAVLVSGGAFSTDSPSNRARLLPTG